MTAPTGASPADMTAWLQRQLQNTPNPQAFAPLYDHLEASVSQASQAPPYMHLPPVINFSAPKQPPSAGADQQKPSNQAR